MSQTAFTFDAPLVAGTAPARAPRGLPGARTLPVADPVGFEIGWDFAHHRLTPPLAHLHAPNPVGQGWSAGRAAFGARTLRATPAVRQWLALRLQAWQHGQAFESVQVTPHFLAQLQVAHCPVTHEPLGDGPGAAADAAIVRLNAGAAFAAGNLAMLGPRAQQALATLQAAPQAPQQVQGPAQAVAAALAHAARIDAGEAAQVAGLDAVGWRRLAVLLSFTTPLEHTLAASLPLLVLPPNRLRVLNPIQALQVSLTLLFCQPGYARHLVAMAALMPYSATRQAFQVFMHTLLARRIAAGAAPTRPQALCAMEAAWADPLVQRRWERLASRLGPAEAEQLLARAARRSLVPSGSCWISAERATDGWSIGGAAQRPARSDADGCVSAKPGAAH